MIGCVTNTGANSSVLSLPFFLNVMHGFRFYKETVIFEIKFRIKQLFPHKQGFLVIIDLNSTIQYLMLVRAVEQWLLQVHPVPLTSIVKSYAESCELEEIVCGLELMDATNSRLF